MVDGKFEDAADPLLQTLIAMGLEGLLEITYNVDDVIYNYLF